MPIEQNVQHIDDLNPQNPPATDPLSQVYNHLNLIKTAVKQTFPNVTDAVTASHTVLNGLDGRVTAIESADTPAIKNTSGTPVLDSGITAEEIRNLIDLGTSDNVVFNQVETDTVKLQAPHPFNGIWTITTSGFDLLIKYNNVTRYKLSSSGTFSADQDIIAEATM